MAHIAQREDFPRSWHYQCVAAIKILGMIEDLIVRNVTGEDKIKTLRTQIIKRFAIEQPMRNENQIEFSFHPQP